MPGRSGSSLGTSCQVSLDRVEVLAELASEERRRELTTPDDEDRSLGDPRLHHRVRELTVRHEPLARVCGEIADRVQVGGRVQLFSELAHAGPPSTQRGARQASVSPEPGPGLSPPCDLDSRGSRIRLMTATLVGSRPRAGGRGRARCHYLA